MPVDLPARVELAEVPFFPQTRDDDCGPAALAMLLRWTGADTDPLQLAPTVYTPARRGSLQPDMIGAARRAGRLTMPVASLNDILTELAAGHPVLVFQNLGLPWWPQWHYAVAVGYDRPGQRLLLHSGKEARRSVPFPLFDFTWRNAGRWALVVLPPDQLPASGDQAAWLQAASELEQTGQLAAATQAYGAVLERSPDSLPALMGWGNARYAAGELAAARLAFQQATVLHPDAGAAWNNYAQALAEQGELAPAAEAARRAVAAGGSLIEQYRATLAAIEQRAQPAPATQ